RTYLRPKQQLLPLLLLRPLLVELNPPALPHHRDVTRRLQRGQDAAARVVQRCVTTQALNRQVGVLRHDPAPEVGVGATTTRRLQVALDDRDTKELVRALHVQVTVHQQDTLTLVAVQRGRSRDVDNREVARALRGGVYSIAPVGQVVLVTVSSPRKGRLRLVGAGPQGDVRLRRDLVVGRTAELGERTAGETGVVHHRRIAGDVAVTAG